MLRRSLICIAVAVFAGLAASTASANVPGGPRLAISKFLTYPRAWSEIDTVGPLGSKPRKVVGGRDLRVPSPFADTRPSWSPDGTRLTFRGGSTAESPTVFVASADGLRVRGLRGIFTDADPVFAPNGREVVFQRLKVVSGQFMRKGASQSALDVRFGIWAFDLRNGSMRKLTPWRRYVSLMPTSFSPDGAILAATSYSRDGVKAVAVRLDGSGSTVLAHSAKEPVYSPEGSRIAFIQMRKRARKDGARRRHIADLYRVNSDGSGLTRLTNTPGKIEAWPSWDPSGERIAFTRFREVPQIPGEPRPGNALMQINSDGSCPTKILSAPGQILYGAAWQPGPGREAGRIEC